jgi:exodeoxyribonuclease-3
MEAAIDGVLVACIYAPNGNPQPGPKFDYKLTWLKRLNTHAGRLLKSGAPVVIAGDFNVVPTPLDIYPTKSWDKDALVQPEGRTLFAKLTKRGWADALRELHPDQPMYTFWSYWRNRYERDAGLRIDHLLLSPELRPRLQAAGVDRKERGRTDPSDHAPAWIRLA